MRTGRRWTRIEMSLRRGIPARLRDGLRQHGTMWRRIGRGCLTRRGRRCRAEVRGVTLNPPCTPLARAQERRGNGCRAEGPLRSCLETPFETQGERDKSGQVRASPSTIRASRRYVKGESRSLAPSAALGMTILVGWSLSREEATACVKCKGRGAGRALWFS
jgi:hypothetical protein